MQKKNTTIRTTRRGFVGLIALGTALLASTALPRSVYAQDVTRGEPFAFSFDWLSEQAQARAAQPHQPTQFLFPEYLGELDYDGYRRIQFLPDHGLWADSDSPYQVHGYHLGWLFKEPVLLFEVDGDNAVPFAFTANAFDYHDDAVATAAAAAPLPGVAGFRINYPLNRAEAYDELISFLGASYFRALGRANTYGLSARGLIINSWREGPEEFPRFSEFYMQRPVPGEPMTVFATLDSPSVTGAYRFVISPASDEAQQTVIEVTARLFFRTDIAEYGIAPLTSMFLFAEANRSDFDDYRPQVHDSNGLFIERSTGETLWRALNNPKSLGNSYFAETNPRRFGLEQRGRDFASYQDAGAHYEQRPSLHIEPVGEWGQGAVRLIEIPARIEADDNIGAFWVPADAARAGETREFSYRMHWGDLAPQFEDRAHVVETRAGQGGVSGVENEVSLRKFVVDFAGGPLTDLDPATELDVFAEVGGAELVHTAVSRIDANGVWRMVLDVEVSGNDLIELRAYLNGLGTKLTETWLYQWRASA